MDYESRGRGSCRPGKLKSICVGPCVFCSFEALQNWFCVVYSYEYFTTADTRVNMRDFYLHSTAIVTQVYK